MAHVNRSKESTLADISGRSWAELCDSSQSSQSQEDINSPLKNDKVSVNDQDDLYDIVFQPVKKETIKIIPQDDLSLTSFMNNVHMVTPIKQENEKPDMSKNVIIDEDTICSPFVKDELKYISAKNSDAPQLYSKDTFDKSIHHAKRRLTSECESAVADPVTPERVNKVNKKSTEHKNIHDSVESPKYEYFVLNKRINLEIN